MGFNVVEKDIQMECQNCGDSLASIIEVDGPKGKVKMWMCQKCGEKIAERFDKNPSFGHEVTCPFCNSTNCKKISGASKVVSAAAFGVFSLGKVTKTWHCNSCGSNFG